MKPTIYKSFFPSLTGFRFVSALLIFLFHYNPFKQNGFFLGICNEMYIGVGMFFVLSGFLITYNYYQTSTLHYVFFKSYFIKRFARIYPVYFLLTIFYFSYIFFKKDHGEFFTQLIFNLFLLKGFSKEYLLTGIVQAWSLTTEECFYIAAPFIFWFCKVKRTFWMQVPVLLLSGIALVFISQTLHIPFFENIHFLFVVTFFGRCFEFFVGAQLALWIKANQFKKKTYKRYTFVGIILMVTCLLLMNGIRSFYAVDHAVSNFPGLLLNNLLLPVAVAFLLNGLIHEKTVLSRLFSSSLFSLLGKASYAFYLIHIGLIADWLTKFTGGSLLIKFIFLQIIAVLIFWLVEKPLNRLIRTVFLNKSVSKRE